jgi:hypothetical protein
MGFSKAGWTPHPAPSPIHWRIRATCYGFQAVLLVPTGDGGKRQRGDGGEPSHAEEDHGRNAETPRGGPCPIGHPATIARSPCLQCPRFNAGRHAIQEIPDFRPGCGRRPVHHPPAGAAVSSSGLIPESMVPPMCHSPPPDPSCPELLSNVAAIMNPGGVCDACPGSDRHGVAVACRLHAVASSGLQSWR